MKQLGAGRQAIALLTAGGASKKRAVSTGEIICGPCEGWTFEAYVAARELGDALRYMVCQLGESDDAKWQIVELDSKANAFRVRRQARRRETYDGRVRGNVPDLGEWGGELL